MKRIISIIVSVLIAVLTLCSCGTETKQKDGLNIVCTAFPQYDFVKNILGSEDGLTLLLDDGADLHVGALEHLGEDRHIAGAGADGCAVVLQGQLAALADVSLGEEGLQGGVVEHLGNVMGGDGHGIVLLYI